MVERQTVYTYYQKKIDVCTPETTLTVINGFPNMSEDEDYKDMLITPLTEELNPGESKTITAEEPTVGYNPVTISTRELKLQDKTINITENKTTTVSKTDNTCDGLGTVTINTNVTNRLEFKYFNVSGADYSVQNETKHQVHAGDEVHGPCLLVYYFAGSDNTLKFALIPSSAGHITIPTGSWGYYITIPTNDLKYVWNIDFYIGNVESFSIYKHATDYYQTTTIEMRDENIKWE